MGADWMTDRALAFIAEKHALKWSSERIADALGISKNQVVGKRNRMFPPPGMGKTGRKFTRASVPMSSVYAGPRVAWRTPEGDEVFRQCLTANVANRDIQVFFNISYDTIRCRRETLNVSRPASNPPLAVQRSPDAAPRPSRAIRAPAVTLFVPRPTAIDFRASSPRPEPRPRLVATDGSEIGPSMSPCQWPVRDGSVTTPWVLCGVDRVSRVYCAAHVKRAYGRQEAA